eukprot:5834930-Karenia_brevis.AAC.1
MSIVTSRYLLNICFLAHDGEARSSWTVLHLVRLPGVCVISLLVDLASKLYGVRMKSRDRFWVSSRAVHAPARD